uniref:Uncharacterized protein n=1 Tax=Globodera pallida TaxID=36090 RepID=A0A183CF12_GLOPA
MSVEKVSKFKWLDFAAWTNTSTFSGIDGMELEVEVEECSHLRKKNNNGRNRIKRDRHGAREREFDDDDWRPPDCATVTGGYGNNIVVSPGTYGFGTFNQHIAYGSQNLRQKFSTDRLLTSTNCADVGLSNEGNF